MVQLATPWGTRTGGRRQGPEIDFQRIFENACVGIVQRDLFEKCVSTIALVACIACVPARLHACVLLLTPVISVCVRAHAGMFVCVRAHDCTRTRSRAFVGSYSCTKVCHPNAITSAVHPPFAFVSQMHIVIRITPPAKLLCCALGPLLLIL